MNLIPGIIFLLLGGLAAGSFYVPYKGVKRWSWETYWLVGGIFSWLLAPWAFALINTRDVLGVLAETSGKTLGLTYLFGLLWGIGGLTFGLAIRYLGMSLGMALAVGFCTVFGTLFTGGFKEGTLVLLGLGVCVVGIVIAGLAGKVKESQMSEVKNFDLKKGLLAAAFSGILSVCFAFGLSAGREIGTISRAHGTAEIWTALPVLIVILLGGFTTNLLCCVLLNIRNRTGYQYFSAIPGRNSPPAVAIETKSELRLPFDGRKDPTPVPLLRNYLFAGLAGVALYFQFIFYSMGESQMGNFKFSSWTLHMALIIIFSSLWGLALMEWKGSSAKAKFLLFAGLLILVLSTLIISYGNQAGH